MRSTSLNVGGRCRVEYLDMYRQRLRSNVAGSEDLDGDARGDDACIRSETTLHLGLSESERRDDLVHFSLPGHCVDGSDAPVRCRTGRVMHTRCPR